MVGNLTVLNRLKEAKRDLSILPSSSHSIYRDIISDNIVRFARDKEYELVYIGQEEIKCLAGRGSLK
jgi:hypothetical protein